MIAKIVKIISNRYTVLTQDNKRINAIAMGKLRLGLIPCVGDEVVIEKVKDDFCIVEVKERKNYLIRPPVANVDQAIIVMSAKDPDFSSALVDRLLFLIVNAKIKPVLCITKVDRGIEDIKALIEEYKRLNIEVYLSEKTNVDPGFIACLSNKISVLTGQSGAGKSTLINKIDPSFNLNTQEISKALGRGKHTTRHCELHPLAKGLVADTPGFSSLDFANMSLEDLSDSVIDFMPYKGMCKFRDCLHINEPGCIIKKGIDQGKISATRYKNYLDVVKIIQNRKERYL